MISEIKNGCLRLKTKVYWTKTLFDEFILETWTIIAEEKSVALAVSTQVFRLSETLIILNLSNISGIS